MSKKDKKSGAGRPTDYSKKIPEIVAALTRRGWNKEDIANAFNISKTTLRNWELEHPELLVAMQTSKTLMIAEVENALFNSAIGYESPPETSMDVVIKPDGSQVKTKIVKKRYIPGSVAAQSLILRNRDPANWKDSTVIDIGDDGDMDKALDSIMDIPLDDTFTQ
jgi:hypothetical protein